MNKLIYLASPYNHEQAFMRHRRYQSAVVAVAHLLHEGLFVYSPILHNHPISCFRDLGRGMEYWEAFDFAMLDRCDELRVLKLNGWDISEGVTKERIHALKLDVKITYMDPILIPNNFSDFDGILGPGYYPRPVKEK